MLQYRINRPTQTGPSGNSIDGFTVSAYEPRPTPTVVVRTHEHTKSVVERTEPSSANIDIPEGKPEIVLAEDKLISTASELAKSMIGESDVDDLPEPPATDLSTVPFGMSSDDSVSTYEDAASSVVQPKKPTLLSKTTRGSLKLARKGLSSAARIFKPKRPKLRDWEEFKIFAAGSTLAAGMIVLGFYLGFNRPITRAETANPKPVVSAQIQTETTIDQSEALPVIKTTEDGQKVEVSEGVNPNNVDRRPPAPVRANLPVRMKISSIGVNAPIRSVGLLPDKSLAVPNLLNQVGWYDQSAHPGEPGTVLMDGHYDPNMTNVVFRRLHEVTAGTEIDIVRGDGQVITYVVQEKASYDKNATPMDKAFAKDDKQRLSIVTCDGKWLNAEKTFSHRLIVYAVRK